MPIPSPRSDEDQDDFIGRCMSELADEYDDQDQRAAVCYDAWRGDDSAGLGSGGARIAPLTQGVKTMAEHLHELRRRRAELVAKMADIVRRENDDNDDIKPDEAATAFAALEVALAALDGRIARLETALAAAAANANGNGDGDGDDDNEEAAMNGSVNKGGFRYNPNRVPATVRNSPRYTPRDPRGIQMARYVLGLAFRAFHKSSWQEAATWVDDKLGDSVVAKALNAGITGEGGALIPQDFLADLIELLRANTVIRGSSPMTVGMPMGNLTIPRLAGGALATYQDELEDMTVSQERFDDINFVAKKLTCLVPVSNDLIRRAPIGVEEVVRDDLVQTIARREDLAFLRGTGTAKDPVGLRNLCLPANIVTVPPTPVDPDNGILPGSQLTSIIAGLSAAILALQNGMSRMIRPVWIMSPASARFISTARDQVGGYYYKDEMARGTLEGYPWKYTQQIPTNLGTGAGSEIYFADFADVIIADTYNVMVDASDVASYRVPPNSTATTGVTISAFQRDQTLFRVIAEHDFNMRHLQSLVILLVSDWTFPGVVGGPGAPWSTQALNPTWSQAPAIRPALSTGANPPPGLKDPDILGGSSEADPETPPTGGEPPSGEDPGQLPGRRHR